MGVTRATASILGSVVQDPNRWKALAVLGIAYLMVILDVSIVNVRPYALITH